MDVDENFGKGYCPICQHYRVLGWFGDKFKICFHCLRDGSYIKYMCDKHETLYMICRCKSKNEIEKEN